MSKDDFKDSKYILLSYVVFVLIVLGSLLSEFNMYKLFYLIAVTVFVIRYFVAISIKK